MPSYQVGLNNLDYSGVLLIIT